MAKEAVGVTIINFDPVNAAAVEQNIEQEILPYHKKLKSQGLRRAIFMMNRESGEALGIAVWDSRDRLKAMEAKREREAPNEVRDPKKAPTDYTKKRAQEIQNVGGEIAKSEWYEIVGEV